MRKKLLSLVLCSVLSLGVLSDALIINAADKIQIGDNAYASVKNTTLTISGEGDTYENRHNYGYEVGYNEDGSVFYGDDSKYKTEESCSLLGDSVDKITKVVFKDGITSIGNHAFTVCDTIKNNVHKGHRGLKSLKSVSLSSTIETIGEGAFYGAKSLTSIEIPSSVKTIKNSAFLSSGLKTLKLNDGVEYIENFAFADTKLTEVNIPGTVKDIGEYAFNTKTIDKVYINEGVENIRFHAFSKITAIFYSKDVIIREGALCPCSTFICYKGSTADTYAKEHNAIVKYLDYTPKKSKEPAVSISNGKLFIACNDMKGVFGYRIRYSKNKSMKSANYRFCKSLSVSGLKKGDTYYVQACAYGKDKDGNRLYGAWSDITSVTVK